MPDTDYAVRMARVANPLREPVLRAAIRALQLPSGSRGLDAGCGIGLQALMLAEAVGREGHVTGLDQAPDLLRYGEKLVEEAGLSGRISFKRGEVDDLPFEENSFDWAWSMDCVGYPVDELVPLLGELSRVVKPGGTVVILGCSSQSLLPGYPLLEARLNATSSSYIPIVKGVKPESNFQRALGRFREAGLEDARGQTFVDDVQAPLSEEIRGALFCFFDMLWGEYQEEAVQEDIGAYRRLCLPESPENILTLPDYYAFFTYTMFRGLVPG